MKWERAKIGDHCEITSSKRIFYSEYVDDGVPFYRSKEIIEKTQGRTLSDPLFISKEKYNEIKEKFGVPAAGDMLLTSVGTIGIPYLVSEADYFYFKDGNLTWFRNFDKCIYAPYLYYWVKSATGQTVLNNTTIGSSQKALTISALKNIEIPLPPVISQQRIAKILSVYDDLIENAQRQIKLLEEAAQRLYKEWFVDLRFPGHEHTKIVDGVPEGWRKGKADSFFDISIGKTPPRAETQWFTNVTTGIPWVSIADMGNASTHVFQTNENLIEEAIERYNVKMIPAGTVLLSFKLTVGRVSITTTDMCTNEAIAHFCTVDERLRTYAYFYLKGFQYEELGSTSSISKAINSKIVKAMPFLLPTEEILTKFSAFATPILEQARIKGKTIIEAQQARDHLLSKLMNKELEV